MHRTGIDVPQLRRRKMTITKTYQRVRHIVEPFDDRFAEHVASWVKDARELHMLAPSTSMPLTAEKVLAWRKKNGMAFLYRTVDYVPVAYGEVNPMTNEVGHLWFGHIIVDPERHGCGIGERFVQALIRYGFEKMAARKISLVVFPENIAAIKCYKKVGFQEVGEEYHQFGDHGPKHRLLRCILESSARLRRF